MMKPLPQRDMSPTDMSPEAVDSRIRDVADLWELWIRLEMDRLDGRLSGPGVRTDSELSSASVVKREPPGR
jgi:hypothetical protein